MKRKIVQLYKLARLKLNRFKTKPLYTGPLFDACHQMNGTVTVESVQERLAKSGVGRMCLFARQQPYLDATDRALEIKQKLGNKIVLGYPKVFSERDDLRPELVENICQEVKKKTYHFVGELQLTHADKWPLKSGQERTLYGERYVKASAPNVMNLAKKLSGTGIPIYFHWETYNWDRDWPEINQLFKSNPNTIFVWPHLGFSKPVQIAEILHRHKNVYGTISKREMYFFDHGWVNWKGEDVGAYRLANLAWQDQLGSSMLDLNGNIQVEWFHLLRRFPDRFMFAVDAHMDKRWGKYEKAVLTQRELLGQLPSYLAEKIAYKTAESLFGPIS
jgi:hypothetical protein